MLTSISKQLARDESAGPTASYAVTAADLRPLHADNSLVKYADDTYLAVADLGGGVRPHPPWRPSEKFRVYQF